MAVYKVPQDVEADDKLIGPFSFRQFIYLIIVAIAIALGWGLSRLFVPLAILPLPVVLFFGVLALPLRKDQPMETYVAAIVSFYLKPRRRLWKPDGLQSLVEITAPRTVEVQRSKDLSQTEAQQRLSYLADIVDTGGWAVRGVSMPSADSSLQNDAFFEAQQAEDILDDSGGVAQTLDTMISQADTKRRRDMMQRLQQPPTVAPPASDPSAGLPPAAAAPTQNMAFNPYPTSMHQMVINPLGATAAPHQPPAAVPPVAATPAAPATPPQSPPTTSEKVVSPDIINLANNPDLSIETIAHEANRIQHKHEQSDDEVVISLR